jgi:flagellar biosynthesis protein FlhB
VILFIHGFIEVLSILSLFTRNQPFFIFEELKENWEQTILISMVSGIIRIFAAIGVFKYFKWGLILGILFSLVTYAGLVFYLPYGMMDAVLSGLTLVLLIMAYWGKEKIDI